MVLDWVGWAATAIFACSYFCRQPVPMRLVQALAALVWIGYGLLLHAAPVIAANLIVMVLATYSAWREYRSGVVNRSEEF